MTTVWIIFGAMAVVSLVTSWSKNAIWGGLTLGVIAGLIVALVRIGSGFDWLLLIKGGILGTLVGLAAELLGMASDKLKNK